ncbi:unnamed protein product [Schistocephalus solidus]|uniref:GIY-YIG domain-containing protein n=1 Tax=Schistocephalus solidus TaxID=70667 RepID=A0A183TQC3_SCHSO|nr:unnamed protein product [Schistocephalus solidus]
MWEVWESDITGVEAHTSPETLTWFSPLVVTVARGVAAGKNQTSRSHSAYVGHIGRQRGTRINEHKMAIRRRDPLSLVFAHAVDCDHRFNWDATEVVTMANTKQTREFLEAWHSSTTSINRHVDLDAHYEGLRARFTNGRQPPSNDC